MRHRSLLPLMLLLSVAACGGGATGLSAVPPALRPSPISPAGEVLGPPSTSGAAYAAILLDWARRSDADGDGRVSAAEVEADTRRFFAKVDGDRDGWISPSELGTYRRARAAELRLPGTGPQASPGAAGEDATQAVEPRERRRGTGRRPAPSRQDAVMAADANADFRVSPEELVTLAQARTGPWDTDRDGALSPRELEEGALARWEGDLRALPKPEPVQAETVRRR